MTCRASTLVALLLAAGALISPGEAWKTPAFGLSDQSTQVPSIRWDECLSQGASWYRSTEAQRIADNVLKYQRSAGGWPKNIDMALALTESQIADILQHRNDADGTIDNGATSTQLKFLARVYTASGLERFQEAFLKGLDYLLAAQYESGGWPQVYPRPQGYQAHITFNDDAMVNVLNLLDDVVRREATYRFVDPKRRLACERAIRQGVECILKCQIRVNGRLTAWCAQHDERSFEPAAARTYEKISFSGMETVGIVRFLMRRQRPDARVASAVESAVAWLSEVKLYGIRVKDEPNAELPRGRDRVVVTDPGAPPLWARFYEIGTNRPIFCGRDGVIKYTLSEIEAERRTGYAWYVATPAKLLAEEYPTWKRRQVR